MNIVTLSVSDRAASDSRVLAAFAGEPQGAHISFTSVDLLWRTLIPERWTILSAMAGAGTLDAGALAVRLSQHGDALSGHLEALARAGVLDRAEEGRFEFLYDAVRVDFTLTAAA